MKRFLLGLIALSILGTVLTIPVEKALGQYDLICGRLGYRCINERYLAFWRLDDLGSGSPGLTIHTLAKCSRSNLAKSLCAIYSLDGYFAYQIKVDYHYIDQEDSLITSSTIIPRSLKPNRLYEVPLMPIEKYKGGITFTTISWGRTRYGSIRNYNLKPLEVKQTN